MKTHAIIPVFIPHKGCPNDCVFCNQKAITARTADVTRKDVIRIIEEYLPTLENRGLLEIELAFFGGSFTGIPMEEQNEFLSVAKEYKERGKINKIHLSTRPDYINEEILDNLKKYDVDVIELGVQSLHEDVLRASNRGHTVEQVYKASGLIKEYGFTLGIQLMIGLPEDTREKSIKSAELVVGIGPEIARLYPTVIIKDTELLRMYESGQYLPMSEEEMIETVKEMYRILTDAGINVIRVGLKSTDLINDGENSKVAGKSYHPAFKQLVTGRLAKEKIEAYIKEFCSSDDNCAKNGFSSRIIVTAGDKAFSDVIGHKGENKKYFTSHYPWLNIEYRQSKSLSDEQIVIEKADETEK